MGSLPLYKFANCGCFPFLMVKKFINGVGFKSRLGLIESKSAGHHVFCSFMFKRCFLNISIYLLHQISFWVKFGWFRV